MHLVLSHRLPQTMLESYLCPIQGRAPECQDVSRNRLGLSTSTAVMAVNACREAQRERRRDSSLVTRVRSCRRHVASAFSMWFTNNYSIERCLLRTTEHLCPASCRRAVPHDQRTRCMKPRRRRRPLGSDNQAPVGDVFGLNGRRQWPSVTVSDRRWCPWPRFWRRLSGASGPSGLSSAPRWLMRHGTSNAGHGSH